jgi:uncharacterized protein YceH (UPF0502 family)
MIDLTPIEARVLGSLIEKSLTTPDGYPLSINSLRMACNQSTNRDPIVQFDDTTVETALEGLRAKQLARRLKNPGERVIKHKHVAPEAFEVDPASLSILCVLMLRGPQTPGELKQRTERLHSFEDLGAIEATLDSLAQRAMVTRLERRPGQKESRWRELLTIAVEGTADHLVSETRPEPSDARESTEPAASNLEIRDARSGDLVRSLAIDTEHEVTAKLARARSAARSWCARSSDDRVALLLEWCERLTNDAALVVSQAVVETGRSEATLHATLIESIDALVSALDRVEDAVGVTAVITDAARPFPIDVLGAALASGRAVLFKPAASATIAGLALVEQLHASGVPVDVAQCVVGSASTGAAVAQCGTDLVVFHGAHDSGAKAVRLAGERGIAIELSLRVASDPEPTTPSDPR